MRTRLATSLVLSSLPLVALADEPKPLSTVVVQGDRASPDREADNPRNPFRLPASSGTHQQVIDREEIERMRPTDVFQLLNSATGVLATQGSRKGFSGLMIRGDSNFIWIIDGAYLQPTTASRILSALPVSAIDEVSVVRGSSALTLGPMVGSASPGGAPVDGFVVIRTRRPKASGVEARIAVESNGTLRASAWGGTRLGDAKQGYVAGLISRYGTDGPSERLDNGSTYNVARTADTGVVKAGLATGPWLIDLLAYSDNSTFQIPNGNSHGLGQGSWYMDPARTQMLVASGSRAWSDRQTTLFSLSRTESRQTFWTANTAAGPYSAVQNDNFVTHLNLRHNVDFGATRVMLGGDALHWNTPTGQQYYEGIPREEKTRGYFAQIEHKAFDKRLSVDASVRRDQVDVVRGLDYYTGGAQPFGGVNSPLRTSNRSLPAAQFYSLGAAWQFAPAWRALGRWGASSQATSGLNPAPDVTLSDDKVGKFELGVEGSVASYFNPSINLFHRTAKNEKSLSGYTYVATSGATQTCRAGAVPTTGALAPATASALTPCYSQSDTTRDGVELVATGVFAERSSYRFGWTHFTRLANSAGSLGATTPRDIVDLSLAHGIGPWTVTGLLKHVASYRGSATDAAAYLGGYTRVDLGLSRDFKLGGTPMRGTLYGRNLGDRRFETTNGIQDVGRVFGVELLAAF